MDEIVIRIKGDTTVIVETKGQDGVVAQKNIAIDDLAGCIKNSISEGTISTGVLPTNCVSYDYNTSMSRHYIVLEYPDCYADVTYMKTLYKDFPLPKLVFGFYIIGETIEKVNVGVTANEKLNEDSIMYKYPFSNVSGFYLCTGANSLPKIKKFSSLTNLPRFILGLPDNDDHYRVSHNQMGFGHRELLEHLTDKTPEYYYQNVLVPMKETSLKHFIDSGGAEYRNV